MNQANVRTLANVGGAGTVISMSNLQGKQFRRAIALTISGSVNNYDIYANRGPTYLPGASDITLTINPGVFVGSTSTGAAALSLPNQFSPGDTVRINNNGVVIGRGGNGGGPNGVAGSPGGPAFVTQRPVTIQNAGVFAGGGGGGGGGVDIVTPGPPKGTPTTTPGGAGGGGAGVQGGTGGSSPHGTGGTGTNSAGGAGTGPAPQLGGAGGGRGLNGVAGLTGGGAGGTGGNWADGNPFITWNPIGTRNGGSS